MGPEKKGSQRRRVAIYDNQIVREENWLMSRYVSVDDPLCYPQTQILINKADLRDQDELDEFEQLMYHIRSQEYLPDGGLDFDHYKSLHNHFFQDVYDWAGKVREIRTGKGGNWFCYPEYIDDEMRKLFDALASENHLTDIEEIAPFADRASHYIAQINAIHPFREGNGRCQLTFLNVLLEVSDWILDEKKLDPNGFMKAMIDSFHGDNGPLSKSIIAMSRKG